MSTNPKFIAFPQALHFAAHAFADLESAPFDTAAYSRMKFGDDAVARRFGFEMAECFFEAHRDILAANRCVIIPAPSTTVPVAATLLSRHFMLRLNDLCSRAGLEAVEWTMVHRNMTYNNNYAHLPKEERKKLLAADSLYFNREFVRGKFLIFIDDVRITGTHEEKLHDFMRSEGMLNSYAFVCFASYTGEDASIEGRLNHVAIKDANDLVALGFARDHQMTTRAIRLFLEADAETFARLLTIATPSFLEATYHAAIVKGYSVYPAYVPNFAALQAKIALG